MGRARTDVNMDMALELLGNGFTLKETAEQCGTNPMTLKSRIEELNKEESALLAYDKRHFLDLIRTKERLIAHMTEDKMLAAPLSSLAQAYGIVAKFDQLVQGRPTEIVGMMGYLMQIEKMEREGKIVDGEIVDGESEEVSEESIDQ